MPSEPCIELSIRYSSEVVRLFIQCGESVTQADLQNTQLTALSSLAEQLKQAITDAAEKSGVAVSERGFISVDPQMRTSVPNIFAIGDIVGNPMLAHKGTHEGHVAAEVATGELKGNAELARASFDAQVIPSVAYTHPEVAWVGCTEEEAKKDGRAIEVARFPWAASGRAIANGAEYGFTKLIFDTETHRVIGGAIVGPSAGDMIGEIALAIEMVCDAVDIGRTIHPHPTLGETIGLAAEVAHGSCTDIPPPRQK